MVEWFGGWVAVGLPPATARRMQMETSRPIGEATLLSLHGVTEPKEAAGVPLPRTARPELIGEMHTWQKDNNFNNE